MLHENKEFNDIGQINKKCEIYKNYVEFFFNMFLIYSPYFIYRLLPEKQVNDNNYL